jgi:molecular chaperone DnaK
VPQIEVTFDIDANGIVHVSAKDLGTGKQQKIRIESSSGLKEDEIKRMVKEAEAHAAEDKADRERAEARNEADSLVYSTEKSLRDYGSKVGDSERGAIETAIGELRKVMDSADARLISQKTEALKTAAFRLAEEVYKASGGRDAENADRGFAPDSGSPEGGRKKDTAGDTDYEVVDDEKNR